MGLKLNNNLRAKLKFQFQTQQCFLIMKIIVSWNGSDDESSISRYEIGLSSNSDNAIPDIASYSSAENISYFVMYHPQLSQGMMVYVMIKAINKAKISTVKVYIELSIYFKKHITKTTNERSLSFI